MFESEILNGLLGGVFAIVIPSLIAIKFLSWLLDSGSTLKHKRVTMRDRIAKKQY